MNTEVTSTVEEIRARNQVQVVAGIHEGSPVNTIPPGFYGFTFAPASFESPLFSRNSFLSFEVHKTAGGAVILGYAAPDSVAKLESNEGSAEVDLYPVAKADATKLVEVPHSRIISAKPLDRAHSNRLRLAIQCA